MKRTFTFTLAVLLAAGTCLSGAAMAQVPSDAQRKALKDKKDKPSSPEKRAGDDVTDPTMITPITETIVGRVIKQVEPKAMVVDIDLRVDGYSRIRPDRSIISELIKFQTAAVIFPVPPVTSTSNGIDPAGPDYRVEVMFDGKAIGSQPTVITGYAGGQRYSKWAVTDIEARTMLLRMQLPVTCAKVVFDEQLALSVPWPKGDYPPDAKSTFQTQLGVDYIHTVALTAEVQRAATEKIIDELIKTWTNGEDPKKLGPVYLAKFLTGQVLELIQPSSDGLAFNRNTSFQGFALQGAAETLTTKKGSEFDVTCALAAVFRRVGLPTRVVIGWDRIGEGGGSRRERFRSWVEFAIIDPISNSDVWVPVDVVRQRRASSRAGALDRKWDYFGGIDDLQQTIPLAFHFHPPTTVDNAGAPCLWGWLTTPTSQIAQQTMTLNARVAPARGGQPKK